MSLAAHIVINLFLVRTDSEAVLIFIFIDMAQKMNEKQTQSEERHTHVR